MKVVLSAEVMAGGPSTVRVKDWVASGVMPLEASMVIGVGALRGRGAGQGGRAVTVVGEGDSVGRAPGLGEGRRRAARRGHGEAPGAALGEGGALAEVIDGATPRMIGLFEALADGPVPTLVTAATVTL